MGSRRLVQFGIAAALVVLILSLAVSFAPSQVVRYLLGAELKELGIEYAGLETLEIAPWTRELRLGPVQFGHQTSVPGRVGELDLTLRFNPLLKRRVSIQRLVMSGIEILVARGADGTLDLNGIALDDLLAPTDETPRPDGKPDDPSGVWTAGVDALELRDAKLIFQNSDGGDLEVDVERLAMTDFRAWDPDQPGRFALAARVNDIQLNWSGEVRPFADTITLAIDSRTQQADLPKLVRFTGPWGLDRRDGTYDAQLEYKVTISKAGSLDAQVAGSIDIIGLDYARSGVFALTAEQARVELDLRLRSSESDDRTLRGDVAVDLGPISASIGEQTRVSAAGTLGVQAIEATLTQDGTLDFAGQPEIDLKNLSLSGPIDISVDTLLELLVRLQSLSATRSLSTADTGLGGLSGKLIQVPASDVSIGSLSARGERFALRSEDGRADLDSKAAIDLDGMLISAQQRSLRIKQARGSLERLFVTAGDGLLRLEMAGSNALGASDAKGPSGEMAIEALEARVDDLALEAQAGALSVQLVASGKGKAFSGLAHAAEGRPQMQIKSGTLSAALTQSSVGVKNGGLAWQAAGDAAADSVAVSFADGESGALKVARAEISALRAESPLRLAADTLAVAGLDLSLTRSLLMALGQSTSATTQSGVAAPVPSPVASPVAPPVAPGAARTAQQQAARSRPDSAAPRPTVDLSHIQTLLAELGYQPGPIDGLMGRRTRSAISAFQTAEGFAVDGRVSADLVAALRERTESSAQFEPSSKPTSEPARVPEPEPRPTLQAGTGPVASAEWHLDRLSLPGNPMVHFRDDLVTPNVVVDARFSRFEAQGLNTNDPNQRALIDVAAEINEHTEFSLSGWIAGLTDPVDLEVTAEVTNLQLTTYSPYGLALAGVHVDGGRLNAATEVKTADGGLLGEVRLEIDQLALQPPQAADAERVGGTIGVSLQTAAELLSDGDGRILLTLPITGTPASPDIDIGPAVNKAIGGVLQQVFPPTLVASMLAGLTKGNAPSLEAIEFAPGSANLTQTGRRYADDVAKLLKQHPKLSLKVCGRASAKDGKALAVNEQLARRYAGDRQRPDAKSRAAPISLKSIDAPAEQALHELAVERQRILTRYLVERAGVDADRVSECRSTFDPKDEGHPRAEVLF
ncbi:MAG: DUF748 domain-containing protein [Thiohalocapsa sp.]